jgi:hypothetical protein
VAPIAAPVEQEPARPPRRLTAPLIAIAGALLVAAAAGLFYGSARTGEEPGGASFQVDPAAVRNTDYKAFCDETGHPYPEAPPDDPNYFYSRPEAPVLNVTHKDAAAFAGWAGKRLPSASEWDGISGGAAIAEWTSTPFTPSSDDIEAFRKLAGAEPQGEWFVVKGGAPLPGLPSESRPRGLAVGFRCVKDR